MAKYSNTEIREAVAEYYRLGSLRKASAKLGIPKSTIALWISNIGTTRFDGRKGCSGGGAPPNHPGPLRGHPHPNRKKPSQDAISPIVNRMYAEKPYLTATEVHLQIVHTMGVECSYATVLRAKSSLGLSRKRAPKIWKPPTKCEEARTVKLHEFVSKVNDIPLSEILSVDETSFDSRIAPLYGYCRKGERLPPFDHSDGPSSRSRLSVITGVSTEGVKGHRIIDGSANTIEFMSFLRDVLPKCPNQKYVLMDNIQFHHNDDVVAMIEESGKAPIYVPPYSPMFNPIENVFSHMKGTYRSVRTTSSISLDPEEFELFLIAWEQVAPEDWTRTFNHCLRKNTSKAMSQEISH